MRTDLPALAVTLTGSAAEFDAAGRDWLDGHAVDANVIATVLTSILTGQASYEDESWVVVRDGERVVGVAMQTAPFPAYLPAVGAEVATAVADAWHEAGRSLPGVNGDSVAAQAFAARWAELAGVEPRVVMEQGVYVLGTLVPPSGVPGRLRPVDLADAPLAQAWIRGFLAEVEPGGPLRDDIEELSRRLERGQLLFWEDAGVPVSMAGWRPAAAGVGRVGPVYTPPEYRGRGYAAAATAAATRAVLDDGARDCMLFTDLANPTSNGVYVRLGYRRVGDSVRWRFDPHDA